MQLAWRSWQQEISKTSYRLAAKLILLTHANTSDRLQCAIPVFDGLLEEPYNSEVLDLLYTMAEWHTLAKLQLHTSTSIGLLSEATSQLGQLLRRFRTFTCSQFATKELPSETAKRNWHTAQAKTKTSNKASSQPKPTNHNKNFSLSTYKLHALGDYVSTIAWFGTTDSYSTQPVCHIYYCPYSNHCW